MKSKLYVIIPLTAFVLILLNAFYGHLLYGSPYDQDINKYSIYVHLQPQWQSQPGNILYDVTIVWSNPNPQSNSKGFYYDSSVDQELEVNYNHNKLQYQNQKSYVQLNHEFSNCESSWTPILYRYAIDSVRNNIQYMQGTQLNNDPYVSIVPNIKNPNYDNDTQKNLVSRGFAQFIPICTERETTSYQYSVSINDKMTAFDVYFIPSENEMKNFLEGKPFSYYHQPSCHATNFQSFSGNCDNIGKESGLLVVIPDNLSLSLTKVSVNLHETL